MELFATRPPPTETVALRAAPGWFLAQPALL